MPSLQPRPVLEARYSTHVSGLKPKLPCRMATLPVQHERWQRPESVQRMFIRENSSPGDIVGTVEVSLVPSTRTRYLTLNAPEVIPAQCRQIRLEQQHKRAVQTSVTQHDSLCPFMKSGLHGM